MTTANLQSLTNGLVAGSLLFSAVMLMFFLGLICVWLVGLIHCIRYKHDRDRMMWVVVVLLGGPVGSLLYWIMGRSPATPQSYAIPPVIQPVRSPGALPRANPDGAAFDHIAMQDSKRRAASINDAIQGMAASRRGAKLDK